MQKLRILLMIDDASLGGGQMHVLLLAKYLRKDGFEVELATENRGWLVDEARNLGIIVNTIAISNKLTWQSFNNIYQLLTSKKFDVLHTHGGTAGFWGRIISVILKERPINIHTYHGLHYLNIFQGTNKVIQERIKSTIFQRIDQFLLAYTDWIICVCNSDYEQAIASKVASKSKTSIVYNGIEIDRFTNPINQEIARQIFNIVPQEFVFGNVGRLHEQKGHKYLLQAFTKVADRARLMIIGDGHLRDHLIRLANELEISDRVVFWGGRSDTHEFLSAIDVFVIPSLWEGQPIALLEALAIGKPCIASSVNGIPEIITDVINGYLVTPKDVEGLAKIMDISIKNPDIVQQLANSGKNTISHKFLAQNMAKAIANIYLYQFNMKLRQINL